MRTVVLGANSAVWKKLAKRFPVETANIIAISHKDVDVFEVTATDIVWIFSYSAQLAANIKMFEKLRERGVKQCVYVSSATANIYPDVTCYAYPTVKAQCEQACLSILSAKILRIGVVYETEADLPAGPCASTPLTAVGELLFRNLFATLPQLGAELTVIYRPFGGKLESILYRIYGIMLRATGRFPCLLRPIDLVLRFLGFRWYGYLYLSNTKWSMTTS